MPPGDGGEFTKTLYQMPSALHHDRLSELEHSNQGKIHDVGEAERIKRPRISNTIGYRLQVVHEALARPAGQRIKPTCRDHPGIEPVSRTAPSRTATYLNRADGIDHMR